MFTLPWPPSANASWRSVNHRVLVSKPYRQYKALVRGLMLERDLVLGLTDPLAVSLILHPPTKRAYDIDNRIKPLLDSLNKLLWKDDCQVCELHVLKGVKQSGGFVEVTVTRRV